MKEGYQKRMDDDWNRSKFIAYITYASITASVGVKPKLFEEWDQVDSEENDYDGPIKDSVEIDADYKAQMEAEMNKM